MDDIRAACDLMHPVWERTDGIDGYVSLEVDPRLAYERERTFEQAVRFNKLVDRPNLYVKIPATEPGLGAIEDCIAKGVLDQRDADLLARALRGGCRGVHPWARAPRRRRRRPGKVLSVASFFVSRVDTEADRRLEELGRADLQGKLAVANAKLAYQHYLDVFYDDRWAYLARQGRAAAALPLGLDVGEEPRLPRRDLRRGADRPGHGQHDAARDGPRLPGPRRGRAGQPAAGDRRRERAPRRARRGRIDYDDVVETLEAEGVEKFADSFAELLDGHRRQGGSLAAA